MEGLPDEAEVYTYLFVMLVIIRMRFQIESSH